MLQNYEDTYENNINSLFKMALDRVAILPFTFLVDMYRYGIFNGSTPENQWNHQWEMLRYSQAVFFTRKIRTLIHFNPYFTQGKISKDPFTWTEKDRRVFRCWSEIPRSSRQPVHLIFCGPHS